MIRVRKKRPEGTWGGLVGELREETGSQPWRRAAVAAVPRWAEFLGGWMAVGQEVSSAVPAAARIPADLGRTFDARLAWAWEQVEDLLPAVLAVVVERTPFSSAEVEVYFRIFQGAGLVFPDGSVSPLLTSMLNLESERILTEVQAASSNAKHRYVRDTTRAAAEYDRAVRAKKEG